MGSTAADGAADPGRGFELAPGERPLRRVLFFGKNMSRRRCTGALVDALESHGLRVKWVNMATLRRWIGNKRSLRRADRLFQAFQPDLVFVFCRDLPMPLLRRFRASAPVVSWVEEPLDDLDTSMVDYLKQVDLVCLSNPGYRDLLTRAGVPRVEFLMSGFSPRYHAPLRPIRPVRDVVFIGGPGRNGQRAQFLAEVSDHFETEIFGVTADWQPWLKDYPQLRVRRPVDNVQFRRLCATSRIVLGLNQVNNDPLYFSNRTFLTLACKGFHLTHYVPGLETVFEDGEHLSWYRDTDECFAKIDRYLSTDDKRRRISEQGHALVYGEHQYFHRVARIREIVSGWGSQSATSQVGLRAVGTS